MKMAKGIVLAEFGNRAGRLHGVIKNIRRFTSLPIHIFSDCMYDFQSLDWENFKGIEGQIVEPHWKEHRRYANRNNDYWKIVGAMDKFKLTLILDDDMRIVNENFTQGFALVERFGMCLPTNPRVYFGLDREVGDDVSAEVKAKTANTPYFLTANNMGVVFLDTENYNVQRVVRRYQEYMITSPCRGPVAMAVSYWNEGFAPYFLPEEWCVCGGYTNFKHRSNKRINPILLHIGHPDIKKWFETEPEFERFR